MFPNIFQLFCFTLLIAIPLASADHDPNNPHAQHQSQGCKEDKDCGENARCNPSTGMCTCPGVEGKDYIIIPEAKPMCQKPAELGKSCKYDGQCSLSTAGVLSRCNNKKCECYDTEKRGRDIVRDYQGTCFRGTTIDEECSSTNQCKASITPEEHVTCEMDPSTGRNKGVCKCEQGYKCEEKSGSGVVQASSLATFVLVGIMATKVIF